jgi:hypothetical protein
MQSTIPARSQRFVTRSLTQESQGEHLMPDTREVRLTRLVAAALLPAALLFVGTASAAPITYDFSIDDGGFTAGGTTGAGQPWSWNSTLGQWEVPQSLGGASGQSWLLSPTVIAGGSTLTLSFDHEHDFDGNLQNRDDYGQLLVNINGAGFELAGGGASPVGTLSGYDYNHPFWQARDSWGGGSSLRTSILELAGLTAGDSVAFQWLASWSNVEVDADPAWYITSAEIDGVDLAAPAPVPEPGTLTMLGLGLAGLALRARRRWSHR